MAASSGFVMPPDLDPRPHQPAFFPVGFLSGTVPKSAANASSMIPP